MSYFNDPRRVVILDDDPTGTQTVSNVSVILNPSLKAYRQFFKQADRAVYVLTNSRAMPQAEAVALIAKIRQEVLQAAGEAGCEVAFLLRGDSTLRGHVFAEIDVFQQPQSVSFFVPAFPEGGRYTIGGIHYLEIQGVRIPVNKTEFAQDTTFGYHSEKLVDFVAEVGQGRTAVIVPLERLRAEGAAAVERALLDAPPGACVIPEAETRADLELAAQGLVQAEQLGRHVVARSASTFAAIRAGLHGTMLPKADRVERVLVVCGSHTEAGTRQLQQLAARTVEPIIIPTERVLSEGTGPIADELSESIVNSLLRHKLAILATERVRKSDHGDLATGAKVMDAIIALVRKVSPYCDGVISKGGLTSAQVATDGLQASSAWVRGQLEPGVSLWELGLPDGRTIPYAVIPGNVGHDNTIADVAERFGVSLAKQAVSEAPGLSAAKPHELLLEPVKKEPIVKEVTRRLMDYLLSGTLNPGDKIPAERQLSEALGIGRSTLREALKTLTVLGLLEVRQGDGTYLKRADSELLPQVIEWGLLLGERRTMDLIEARQKIEVIIASLAAERHTPAELQELGQTLQLMQEAGTNYSRFVAADIAFHMMLADMARNTALRDILKGIRALLKAWITSVLQSSGGTAFSYEEHAAIYAAIQKRDAQAASEAMEAHMLSASQRLYKAQAGAEEFNLPEEGKEER
jgi:DNA-binding FadR family transcriptional regulator/uncharacterized protein YgbK (DUF1537 family)